MYNLTKSYNREYYYKIALIRWSQFKFRISKWLIILAHKIYPEILDATHRQAYSAGYLAANKDHNSNY